MNNDLPQKLYATAYNEKFTFDLLFSSKPRSFRPQQYWIEDDYERERWLKLSGSTNSIFIHSSDGTNHWLTHTDGHDLFLRLVASERKD